MYTLSFLGSQKCYVACVSHALIQELGVSEHAPFIEVITQDAKSEKRIFYFKAEHSNVVDQNEIMLSLRWKETMSEYTLVKVLKHRLTHRRYLNCAIFEICDKKNYNDTELRYVSNELFSMSDCIFNYGVVFLLRDGIEIKLTNFSPGLLKSTSVIMINNKSANQFVCPFFLRNSFPTFTLESPINKEG